MQAKFSTQETTKRECDRTKVFELKSSSGNFEIGKAFKSKWKVLNSKAQISKFYQEILWDLPLKLELRSLEKKKSLCVKTSKMQTKNEILIKINVKESSMYPLLLLSLLLSFTLSPPFCAPPFCSWTTLFSDADLLKLRVSSTWSSPSSLLPLECLEEGG